MTDTRNSISNELFQCDYGALSNSENQRQVDDELNRRTNKMTEEDTLNSISLEMYGCDYAELNNAIDEGGGEDTDHPTAGYAGLSGDRPRTVQLEFERRKNKRLKKELDTAILLYGKAAHRRDELLRERENQSRIMTGDSTIIKLKELDKLKARITELEGDLALKEGACARMEMEIEELQMNANTVVNSFTE